MRRPSSSVWLVSRSHWSSVSVDGSRSAPVFSSRYIAGMTTMCSPPTALVSAATSVTCFQVKSHESGWCSRENTVPASTVSPWASRASDSSRGSEGRYPYGPSSMAS
jgi:hypothetical protein